MLNALARQLFLLMKKHFYHFVMQLGVRLIAHRKVKPGLFVDDALVVRKRVKTCLSVISAHAAFAHASKSHIGSGKMYYGIIYAAAAECKVRCKVPACIGVA